MWNAIKVWLGVGGRDLTLGHTNGHDGDEAAGHGHTHGVIDPSLSSSDRGIWAIKWSFVILAITAALQLIVVFISGSVALAADMIHNVADATTAIPLWIAFVLVRRKPTATFNYGLGRVEDLAGMAIILIILFSAIVAAWESVDRLFNPEPISQLLAVAVAGVIGFIGNEAVAIFRIKVGREMNSAALIADGYHARTDGLTSLAVVVGAFGVWMGFPLADPIVGLLITIAIFGIVWQSARAVITRSLDGIEPAVTDEIRHAAEHVPGVSEVVNAKARWLGHKLRAEVTIAVDKTLTVADANAIAARLESELHAHIAPLEAVSVLLDRSDAVLDIPAAGNHDHAPQPFRVKTSWIDGELRILDTPEGERMRLTLVRGIQGLEASVKIDRPGGQVESLQLLPASPDHKLFQSMAAPDEPHEFDAQLLLRDRSGSEDVLSFRMREPEGHHH